MRRLRWHVEDDLRHSLGAFDLMVGADLVSAAQLFVRRNKPLDPTLAAELGHMLPI